MFKRLSFISPEGIFFYTCLGISLIIVILNGTNPSLDGPSHLYNSQVVNYLVRGDKFISTYYTLNKIPVPNLTDHYLLAIFMNFFSWQISEKLMTVIYLLSFPLLFRMLIKQWKEANIALSIFAIPFSFSYLYYLGFYNFCLSFPLLFGIIVYHRKYFSGKANIPWKNYFILCLLATLLYFTNGLAFLFIGLTLFLMELPIWIRLSKTGGKGADIKRPLLFFLTLLPGSLCFLIFLYRIPFNYHVDPISLHDLLGCIYSIQPLVVDRNVEPKITKCIFYLVIAALFTMVYFRIKNKRVLQFNSSDIFLFLSLVALSLYIIIPNGASVGMMSVRLCYCFFIFLLFWIALQQGSRIVTWIVSIVVIIIHFTLLLMINQPAISTLNKEMDLVRNASSFIKPNSVVLSICTEDNWVLDHFPDYLGIDKPIVILPNYEADDGWFAVTWNNYIAPRILLGEDDSTLSYLVKNHTASIKTKTIDYVFIYGNYTNILQKQCWKTLNETLKKDYELIYTSQNNDIHILSLNHE